MLLLMSSILLFNAMTLTNSYNNNTRDHKEYQINVPRVDPSRDIFYLYDYSMVCLWIIILPAAINNMIIILRPSYTLTNSGNGSC